MKTFVIACNRLAWPPNTDEPSVILCPKLGVDYNQLYARWGKLKEMGHLPKDQNRKVKQVKRPPPFRPTDDDRVHEKQMLMTINEQFLSLLEVAHGSVGRPDLFFRPKKKA